MLWHDCQQNWQTYRNLQAVRQFFIRRLLFLAFRHHMPQICASPVFDAFFLRKIELFSRLKTHWEFIDWFSFDPLSIDVNGDDCLCSSEKVWLESRCAALISSLPRHIEDIQPRDDYHEFATLALWLLGFEHIEEEVFIPRCLPSRPMDGKRYSLLQDFCISSSNYSKPTWDGLSGAHASLCSSHVCSACFSWSGISSGN